MVSSSTYVFTIFFFTIIMVHIYIMKVSTCNETIDSTFTIALTSREEGGNGMMYRRDLAVIYIFFLFNRKPQ